ncbi:MAG: hypothetical protein ACI4PS_01825 [Rhodocyclaceae bacterium]
MIFFGANFTTIRKAKIKNQKSKIKNRRLSNYQIVDKKISKSKILDLLK